MQDHHLTTTVAILGSDTVVGRALCALLEGHGYQITLLDSYPTRIVDELRDGVDVLVLTPGQRDGVREGHLEAMRSALNMAAIPVLSLSAALKLALLDRLACGGR